MNRVCCVFALATLMGLSLANAGTITVDSAPFTFAFSAVDAGPNCWALEPTGGNSEYTQGDFSFTPAPAGEKFSGTGPVFDNRVIADGGPGRGAGYTDVFSMPIDASYNAAIPSGATNVQLMLEVTNLSIYAMAYTGGDASLAWNEAGGQTSSSIALNSGTGTATASNYTLLAWNPSDQYVAGTSDTRTFNFGTAYFDVLDGLEVMGVVHLSYETVPEPSTLALVATGMFGLLAYAWKKRR